MKFDIGCGENAKSGYIGIDPILCNSFWDMNPTEPIEELRFVHSIYMLADEKFKRREDMDIRVIKRKVQLYLKKKITIYELNESIFGKENFNFYFNRLQQKTKELVNKMPNEATIIIEQPVLNRMVQRKWGLIKELYRIIRYRRSCVTQALIAEFSKTYNFMTCDVQLLSDFLESVGMSKITIRDGVLEESSHMPENCIVLIGIK